MTDYTTKDREQRFAVLLSILDIGGNGSKQEVLNNLVEKEFIFPLYRDFELTVTNEPKWKNELSFKRNSLREEGFIDGSEHNNWAITGHGEKYFIDLYENFISKSTYEFLDNPAYVKGKKIVDILKKKHAL